MNARHPGEPVLMMRLDPGVMVDITVGGHGDGDRFES